jgi:hypothetical protein
LDQTCCGQSLANSGFAGITVDVEIPFIAEHLILVINEGNIVSTMHNQKTMNLMTRNFNEGWPKWY